MTFGVNQAKSYATKEFKSLEDIKKSTDKLISKEEMTAIDESNKELFFKISDKLNYVYQNQWDKLDSLGRALMDHFKGKTIRRALSGNDFEDMHIGESAHYVGMHKCT
jgi:hypothetical protein